MWSSTNGIIKHKAYIIELPTSDMSSTSNKYLFFCSLNFGLQIALFLVKSLNPFSEAYNFTRYKKQTNQPNKYLTTLFICLYYLSIYYLIFFLTLNCVWRITWNPKTKEKNNLSLSLLYIYIYIYSMGDIYREKYEI